VKEKIEEEDAENRGQDDHDLIEGNAHSQKPHASLYFKSVGSDLSAPEKLGGIPQEERKAQGRDEEGQTIGKAKGLEDKLVYSHPEQDGEKEGGWESKGQRKAERFLHEQIEEVSAPHDQFTMGKVDKVEDPVNQRQAHGKQGIDAAGENPVENRLKKEIHLGCKKIGSGEKRTSPEPIRVH
jgi:hypothetical protein